MAHPKGKTSEEVSGVPGWCYRCRVRSGPWCQMYSKSCVEARKNNDCVRRPRVDRLLPCKGKEISGVRGLHRTDVDICSVGNIFLNKNRKKNPIVVDRPFRVEESI